VPDDSIWEENENRETRMPCVDGVPITEGLSRGAGAPGVDQGGVVAPQVEPPAPSESSSRKRGADGAQGDPATTEPGRGRDAGRTQSSGTPQVSVVGNKASRCTYDPLPGMKCPACGKLHVRQARSVKIHVPAGDDRSDFKRREKR